MAEEDLFKELIYKGITDEDASRGYFMRQIFDGRHDYDGRARC